MPAPLSDGNYPIIPPEELRCVWMSAGVLSYQLCDRQYDCDHCLLDQALHMHSRNRPAKASATQGAKAAGSPDLAWTQRGRLRPDRLYSRSYCWVMWCENPIGEDALIHVGLEPHLAAALLSPRSVIHAEIGADLERGDTAPWIMTDGGTLNVLAPLRGTLHQANALLHDQPHLICSRPLDEGWLYALRVRPDSPELGILMSASAATRLYDVVATRFHESLQQALLEVGAPLPAPAEPEVMLQGIADSLGAARYFALLRSAYG